MRGKPPQKWEGEHNPIRGRRLGYLTKAMYRRTPLSINARQPTRTDTPSLRKCLEKYTDKQRLPLDNLRWLYAWRQFLTRYLMNGYVFLCRCGDKSLERSNHDGCECEDRITSPRERDHDAIMQGPKRKRSPTSRRGL